MFLASLLESVENFLRRKATANAVITVPPSFTPAHKMALEKQSDADVHVMQLLGEAWRRRCDDHTMEHDPSC